MATWGRLELSFMNNLFCFVLFLSIKVQTMNEYEGAMDFQRYTGERDCTVYSVTKLNTRVITIIRCGFLMGQAPPRGYS